MTLTQQLKEALYLAPISLRKLRSGSLSWMLVYFLSGLAIFSLFTWVLLENQHAIKSAILNYFFPQSWHEISVQLGDFLFETQAKVVIGNMILGASLVVASIFLFPLKEKYSAQFEKDASYKNGPAREFPLLMQAWEETKLFLLYLTAQSVILWIGYYPYAVTKTIAIILSYLFLFFTFGLDFISPTLQRHRTAYTLILKVLWRKPLLVLAFGTLFSLPVVLLSRFMFTLQDWTLIEIASVLFLINIIFLTLAVPVGTRIASRLMPVVKRSLPLPKSTKVKGYSLMLIILVFMLFLHGGLIASLHHKSQILKADYSVDWSSIQYDLPSFTQFFNEKALTNLSFDVVIDNPTQFDIKFEDSQVFVEKKSSLIATIDISGFEIPAGESRKVKLKLDSTSNLGKVTNFREILEDWRVDLQFELWPGIPFIFNIAE